MWETKAGIEQYEHNRTNNDIKLMMVNSKIYCCGKTLWWSSWPFNLHSSTRKWTIIFGSKRRMPNAMWLLLWSRTTQKQILQANSSLWPRSPISVWSTCLHLAYIPLNIYLCRCPNRCKNKITYFILSSYQVLARPVRKLWSLHIEILESANRIMHMYLSN